MAMAHNVPGCKRLFFAPDKENAKRFYGRKKMCWSKTAQKAKPDCGFAEAEPPKGGKAYTVLLCAGLLLK
jgi:hypothetical protein